MRENKKISPKYQIWINARKQYKLSNEQIQMARELGYNPKQLKRITEDDTLKLPLAQHVESEYRKKFNREKPERVVTIEELFEELLKENSERKK